MRIFYIIYKYRTSNICILWNNMQSLHFGKKQYKKHINFYRNEN